MPVSTTGTRKSVRQLLVLAAIMVLGYICMGTFRFTVGALNQIFYCAYLLVPFLAIKPVLRLRRWSKAMGLVLLAPLLLVSGFLLLGDLVFGAGGREEHSEPLQAFQQGGATIELGRYENGGAVGVHGMYLEQRRLIVPGLYLVKAVDFFSNAREVTMAMDGPYKVKVHAEGSYDDPDFKVDKVYLLKPWIYF